MSDLVSAPIAQRLSARAYASAADAAADICRNLREVLGVGAVYATRVSGELMTVVAADDRQRFGLSPRLQLPLRDTFCYPVLRGTAPAETSNAADGPFRDVPAREALGITSYISVPLQASDGRVLGTLCGIDRGSVVVGTAGRDLLASLGGLLAREMELEELRERDARRAARHAAVARFSARALAEDDLERVLHEGVRVVSETLGVPDCHVLELLPDQRHLRPWVGTLGFPDTSHLEDWPDPAGRELVLPVRDGGLDGATLRAPGPLVIDDLQNDPRAADAIPLLAAGYVCGVTSALRTSAGTYGILGAFTTESERTFEGEDLDLLHEVTNLLAGAIARRRAEDALRWRSRLDRAMTVASTQLISLASGELDSGVENTLAAVGELLGADRGLVFQVQGQGTWDSTHEWNAWGAEPSAPPLQGLDEALPPWLLERLRQGEVVHLASVDAMPEEARREHEFLRGRGVVSMAGLPMLTDGRLVGMVTFSTRNECAGWPDDIVACLRPVGDMLANAIWRQQMALDLEASELRFRSLVDEMRDIVVRIGADGHVAFVNRAMTEFTGIPVEDIIGRSCLDSVYVEDRQVAAEHMASLIRGDTTPREVRFVTGSGDLRWMLVTGRALLDDEGAPAGFSGLLHDITERHEAEQRVQAALREAEAARDQAERASGAKSEFLSRTSHELRTPLNAILGFGQLLELTDLAEEDAESVAQILRAGRHLLDLINEVLEISRIETGRLTLSLEPVSLRESVSESLDLVRTAAAARNLDVRVGAGVRTGQVVADRQRLKQVLVNLLSNAVKYNRDGGRVDVSCEPLPSHQVVGVGAGAEHGWLRLRVTDTGIGIAADRLADVWVPFERLGAELTDVEGSGVGLALTKSLVEAMGGRIDVVSSEGVGTTITVDLPAAVAVGADADEETPGAGSAATSTIFYIEDNPSNVTLVRRILARRPHTRLVVATDGATGLGLLPQVRPDLVLLDLHLPELDGACVLAALRGHADAHLRDVPVVVVTADATPGTERRLLDAGASDFLSKPIDVQRFLEVVDGHVPAPATASCDSDV